ncbi:unnamed protein product [Meganyctiphanes norvegica]|uniref:C2H2-type domain-containing protein n=1 Tax=Meganyctiphanes norvegica TaxID=48144 RepID=A0AAV2SJN4_MEGNR
MNKMGYDENDNNGFECSECDFKCSSETAIMEHSAMHQCQRNDIDSSLDIIENDSMKVETAVIYQSKFNGKNEIESCSRLKDPPDIKPCGSNIGNEYKDNNIADNIQDNLNTKETFLSCIKREYVPDINDHDNKPVIKTEPYSCEVISTDENYHEIENGNKKLKVENLQIEHKIIPNHSLFYQNEHDNLQPDQNSNNYDKYVNDKLHSDYKNINIFTTNGILNTTNNGCTYGSLSYLSEPSQNNLSFSKFSHNLTPWEITSARTPRIEIEVDNTAIYIPPGWTRKLYMRTGPYNGHEIKYDCYYFTELGLIINSKKSAHDYLIKNPSTEVDIGKLTFPLTQKLRLPDNPRLEVDVDNTGIYIPEGWQRKLSMSKVPNAKMKCRTIYICPEGQRFWDKSRVYLHMFSSVRIKDKYIDLEKMNFSDIIQSFNEFSYIFDVRRIVPRSKVYTLYICRLCSYLNRIKIDANSHISEHSQKLNDIIPPASDLPNKYDYFVCTDCHGKIMKRKDIQAHLQGHNTRQISGTVVGVRCEYDKKNYIKRLVHCCEVCDFG